MHRTSELSLFPADATDFANAARPTRCAGPDDSGRKRARFAGSWDANFPARASSPAGGICHLGAPRRGPRPDGRPQNRVSPCPNRCHISNNAAGRTLTMHSRLVSKLFVLAAALAFGASGLLAQHVAHAVAGAVSRVDASAKTIAVKTAEAAKKFSNTPRRAFRAQLQPGTQPRPQPSILTWRVRKERTWPCGMCWQRR